MKALFIWLLLTISTAVALSLWIHHSACWTLIALYWTVLVVKNAVDIMGGD